MSLNLYIFEDSHYRQFLPLTWLRPVCLLRAGIRNILERIEGEFGADQTGLIVRNGLSAMIASTHPGYPVNIIKSGEGAVLFVNGRLRNMGDLPSKVSQAKETTVFLSSDKEIVAVLFTASTLKSLPAVATQQEYVEFFGKEEKDFARATGTATLYNYCWEIMHDIPSAISEDYSKIIDSQPPSRDVKVHNGSSFINESNLFLADGVEVYPGTVLDASSGPIYIGAGARLEANSTITGPCFIGAGSVVSGARVYSSSIGQHCRIGGEVADSVFHAYVNKAHEGFIGHSYVGAWVNFGALTTNSDLKNNYSNISLVVDGKAVDSGSIKVGSFVGDHSKFGIGTLLNTGINIGISCNIFGGSLIADKEVASFSWGSSDSYQKYEFEKAIETARIVCKRRGHELSDHEIELMQAVSENQDSDEGVVDFAPVALSKIL